MNILEWPADLTDFRLPPAWDGRPVDWHGWHQPIEARALFPCENNGLRRDPQPCSGCGHPFQPWWAQGLTAAGLAMALLLMAFGALATLGGALLLRLLSGIRIMTAISQAAAATFFILLMPAGVCRLIARIRGWDPDPDPTERN